MMLIGIILLIFLPMSALFQRPATLEGLITGVMMGIIIGGGLLVYGSYVWKKVTHVVWTKQAIREMMDKGHAAEEEFRRRYTSSSQCDTKITCQNCGSTVNSNDIFCGECGKKIVKEKQNLICSNCKFESEEEFTYCPECGQKHPGDKKQ